ncbi:MAG: glycosyltransferase family 1 protein [Desulfovibrionaceae bacterium]
MRIGIDAHVLGKNKGGVERYLANLLERLPGVAPDLEFLVFVRGGYRPTAPVPSNMTFVDLPTANPLLERSLVLPFLARRHALDVLHVQRVAPPFPGCQVVVSIHDLLPLTNPSEHRGLNSTLVRLLTPGSVRRARRILTVSNVVRNEIVGRFDVPAEKVVAIHNGVDMGMFHLTENDPGWAERKTLLFVGALEPRKNVETLLRSFAAFRFVIAEGKLRIVGGERALGYLQSLKNLTVDLGIVDHVEFLGYVADGEYRYLLNETRILVAPSTGEGFNIPPLEAMACGVPVVCSDIAVHRELFAQSAILFNATSSDALAQVLVDTWGDETEWNRLRQRGLEQAPCFTWERTAELTARVYRELGDGANDRS